MLLQYRASCQVAHELAPRHPHNLWEQLQPLGDIIWQKLVISVAYVQVVENLPLRSVRQQYVSGSSVIFSLRPA